MTVIKWSSKVVWVLCLGCMILWVDGVQSWGSKDPGKVLLRDIQVLTLRQGKMTTGKRSSVPQLKCVGGSAQGAFNPQVVQCYNRGWDGVDVQWECKADMDNLYRFGEVEVVCEGYDYPEDAYITKGSCGLEYTLEYTQEGRAKKSQGGGGGGGWFAGGGDTTSHSSSYSDRTSSYKTSDFHGKWQGVSDLVFLGGIAFAIYAIYKCCLAPSLGNNVGDRQYSSTDGDYPTGGPGGGGWTRPPGHSNHTSNTSYGGGGGGHYDGGCGGGGDTYSRPRAPGTGGTGGFWSGMATGGLLGYLFGGGGGGRGYYNNGYGYGRRQGYGTWGGSTGGSSWFGGSGGGGGGSFSSSSSSSSSSGTRTASGFGGTRRR